MAKLVITHPGKTPVHLHIPEGRMLIGRGEACQVCLEGGAVSKEHAAIVTIGNDEILEDLGSTNGTIVNGQRLSGRYVLQNRDEITIGGYSLQYVSQRAQKHMDFDKTMMFEGGAEAMPMEGQEVAQTAVNTARAARATRQRGGLRGLKGRMAGQSIELDRVIRRIGTPGSQTAAILRRPHGYYLMHVEGGSSARLNGSAIGQEWRPLAPNDVIEVGGDTYSFHLDES
jgi:hypothetical protein